jgi:hypothetical protein
MALAPIASTAETRLERRAVPLVFFLSITFLPRLPAATDLRRLGVPGVLPHRADASRTCSDAGRCGRALPGQNRAVS